MKTDHQPEGVAKILELSTAHLPEQVMTALVGMHHMSFGAFAFVPDVEDARVGRAPELSAVLDYALTLGCRFVLFDMDAPRIDALPTWDW